MTLARDLRHAVRTLRRDAALTTFEIVIIGVAVGASTTVFGVVDALWLMPLPSTSRNVWIADGPAETLSRSVFFSSFRSSRLPVPRQSAPYAVPEVEGATALQHHRVVEELVPATQVCKVWNPLAKEYGHEADAHLVYQSQAERLLSDVRTRDADV